MAENAPARSDPIGEKYFRPLEIADQWSDRLFYVAAMLSFAVLLVEKSVHPTLYDVVQIIFVLAVVAVFLIGLSVRLHWRPIAEDRRRVELLTNASNVSLTHERTEAYYNNEQTDPTRRLGASILENSFFSRAVTREMCVTERVRVIVYATVFLSLILVRQTDLAVTAAAAQAVFSEQILSRWFRLEWWRSRCNATFDQLYSLFQSNPAKSVLYAKVLELFAYYECGKSNAGITVSSKIFFKRNSELTREWDEIRKTLKL
jgi:hypothetical protein